MLSEKQDKDFLVSPRFTRFSASRKRRWEPVSHRIRTHYTSFSKSVGLSDKSTFVCPTFFPPVGHIYIACPTRFNEGKSVPKIRKWRNLSTACNSRIRAVTKVPQNAFLASQKSRYQTLFFCLSKYVLLYRRLAQCGRGRGYPVPLRE